MVQAYVDPISILGLYLFILLVATVVIANLNKYVRNKIQLSRRKRKKLGLCVKCGYNLTGLTELRCPECGEAFEESCSAKP